MATVGFLKTLLHSCFVQVFQNHTNQQPSNTLTTSQLLPTIKYWILLHKYSKNSLEERLKHLDKAHRSTSSQQQRTLAKSAPSVEKQTIVHKITGQWGETQIQGTIVQKFVKFIWKKEGRQKGQR